MSDQQGAGRPAGIGVEIHGLITELFPICRSITGDGVRRTLEILRREVPLTIHEVPSGTKVFDWTVPDEWNIRGASIKGPDGTKVLDFESSNLHVVSYSVPVRQKMPLEELKKHLHTLPEHPDWIPYRTSYYRKDWGFCLSHMDLQTLRDGDYEVAIDATLKKGSLTYGELVIKGGSDEEILISTHVCHPSLANDNLSGVGLAAFLARDLARGSRRYSYRFLFIPATIGAITWLCLNEASVRKIKAGLVLTGLGDRGPLTYKKSRRGGTLIDRAAGHALRHGGETCRILDFHPYGYDERQYSSPGFDLPVGRMSRTPHGEYPEYHTSADNLAFVTPAALEGSYDAIRGIVDILEGDRVYRNLNPKGEPQLGRRGLYKSAGGDEIALLWVLNLSDGGASLLEIAERAGLPFAAVERAARRLVEAGLLREEAPSGLGRRV